ncbi:MAG: hypothetical protein IPL53_15530 [Ignavibacteria bacterium]|nr:hypothetical protein [Ignavibacteria bacterium]
MDISPSKYKYLATLNGGYVANNYYIGYNSNFIINARFSYFYSEKKSLGADFTYTSFAYDDDIENYGADFAGGKQSYFDLLLNAQIGTFEKSNDVDAYVNVGAGVHVSSRTSSVSTYYSFNDTNSFSYTNPSSTRFYAAMQIGGGLIIKPIYNIGINLEADMVVYFSGVTIIFQL